MINMYLKHPWIIRLVPIIITLVILTILSILIKDISREMALGSGSSSPVERLQFLSGLDGTI